MYSPYNRNNYKKRTTKRKTNTNITSTLDVPKNENSKSTTNKKTENNAWKGGDPTTNVHMTGKELIEQAFSENKNNQDQNTNFFTIAWKMVDNIWDFQSLNV